MEGSPGGRGKGRPLLRPVGHNAFHQGGAPLLEPLHQFHQGRAPLLESLHQFHQGGGESLDPVRHYVRRPPRKGMGEKAGGALGRGKGPTSLHSTPLTHKKVEIYVFSMYYVCVFSLKNQPIGKFGCQVLEKIDQWENSDAKNPVQSELSKFMGLLFWDFGIILGFWGNFGILG